MINYFHHINEFRRKAHDLRLSATEISLYYALVGIWNDSGYKTDFDVYRDSIIADAAISYKTYLKCREGLREKGLIHFTEGQHCARRATFKMVALGQQATKAPQEHKQQQEQQARQNYHHSIDPNIIRERKEKTSFFEKNSDSVNAPKNATPPPNCAAPPPTETERAVNEAINEAYCRMVSKNREAINFPMAQVKTFVRHLAKETGKESTDTSAMLAATDIFFTNLPNKYHNGFDFQLVFINKNFKNLFDYANNEHARKQQTAAVNSKHHAASSNVEHPAAMPVAFSFSYSTTKEGQSNTGTSTPFIQKLKTAFTAPIGGQNRTNVFLDGYKFSRGR